MRNGVDSAYAPTLAEAQAAKAMGITYWGLYLAGPSALHNWATAEIDILRQAGFEWALPFYVPQMTRFGTIGSQTPEADAENFVNEMAAASVLGMGCLDTEASMRNDPWTAPYTARFCAELRILGQADACYAGAFSFSSPPEASHPMFIWPGNPPAGQCYQWGSGTIAEPSLRRTIRGPRTERDARVYGGQSVSVDWEIADDAFPLASLVSNPPPVPPIPSPVYAPAGGDVNAPTISQAICAVTPLNRWVETAQSVLSGKFNIPIGAAGVDGNFGPATDAAVREYQSSFNAFFGLEGARAIAVDGVIGPVTWNCMEGF